MRRVVIVGGGSAGWMTAAYLNGALNNRGQNKTVDITLIESPDIPRISVGEATVPSIHHMLDVIGVDEADFMKATDATFKQSIKYVNWLNNKGEYYHHPFSRATLGPIDRTGKRWMESQRDIPFIETVSAQAIISEINRAPKPLGDQQFMAPLKYAYHFDAQLYADYLRDFSTARGVSHILANVVSVEQTETGYLKQVNLDTKTSVSGDIFIDCTGFKAVLIEKTLKVPFDDYSQWLLCDQALVTQFPYEDYFPGVIRPYTTCTAQSAGWIWDTPTQTRRAIGYVHSSEFIDAETAKAELLAYQSEGLKDCDTRLIRFKVGQRQKAWSKNCIAIGLSGGFIEPLESTGIHMAELAAVQLAEHFPYKDEDIPAFSFRLNRIISNRYYEILDFINLHYCLTRRNDTAFWREVQKPERINDRLKAKLEHWRKKEPTASDFQDQSFYGYNYNRAPIDDPEIDNRPPVDTGSLWNHASYEAILFGMDFRGPEFAKSMGDKRPHSRPVDFVLKAIQQAPKELPPHHVWLHQALGMQAWDTHSLPDAWPREEQSYITQKLS